MASLSEIGKRARAKWMVGKPTIKECDTCSKPKGIREFWDARTRQGYDTCGPCRFYGVKEPYSLAYSDYIQSKAWRAKREEYWNSHLVRECYVCAEPWTGFKGKDLHHRTYDRLGDEALHDLVPVCRRCHDLITFRWNHHAEKDLTLWDLTETVRKEWKSKGG